MERHLLSMIVLAFSLYGYSQKPVPFPDARVQSLYQFYSSGPGLSDELVNGKEYFPYYSRSRQKPVLFGNTVYRRSIIVNGRKYDNVSLFYDTYTGEVIFMDTSRIINSNVLQIVINRNIIDSFSYYLPDDTITFRYFSTTADPSFNLSEGFYEVACENKIVCLINHRSVVYEKNGIDEYYYKPVLYIKSGNGFSGIRIMKQFLRLFDDRQGVMKKVIRKQKISFRNADKKPIIKLLQDNESLLITR